MALQDTVTKQYMSKGEIFADAFNYLIYSGRQVIRPDQLSEMDTTQIAIPFAPQEQGKPETTQKYRDVLKTLSVKKDKTCTYLVLGIENQSRVHYAMPIRNMLYDVLDNAKLFTVAAEKDSRSFMNVTFRTASADLDAKFVAESVEQGFTNLKGHRSVGGMRASIYNAMPTEGVEKLCDFIKKFDSEN
mgnify:FL=1